MDHLQFDIQSIDDLVGRLREASTSIEDELEQLDRRVIALDGEWSGEAKEAYRRAHKEWVGAMTSLNDALRKTGHLARAHSEAYAEVESEVAKLFG